MLDPSVSPGQLHTLTLWARAGPGPALAHRVSRPRGTGSVGDSVGEGKNHFETTVFIHRDKRGAVQSSLLPF